MLRDANGKTVTSGNLDDGAFICEIPGFLMHKDEVAAGLGIPMNCVSIAESDLILDTEGTASTIALSVRRGFRSNCIARLMRISGDVRVGLFATRMKGPLVEDRPRRGPAIPALSELVLPFDGELPYAVKKYEWRDRRTRTRPTRKLSQKEKPSMLGQLTLLSSFVEDIIPPMPFILVRDRASAENCISRMQRDRNRGKHSRNRRGGSILV
jgi:hypothetical protein